MNSPDEKRTSTIRASLQWPYRASLRVDAKAQEGENTASQRFLVGEKTIYTSIGGASAKTEFLRSQEERQQALFGLSSSAPSLAFSFLAFRAGVNPVRHQSTVAVRVSRLRDGKTNLQNVVISQRSSTANEPLETYEYGFDTRGQLRRFSTRRTLGGQPYSLVARFEPVVSNWKGLQAQTDALVYNWNIVAPGVKVRPVVQPRAYVSQQARAIFARATKLYSGAQTLRLKWKVSDEDTEETEDRELRLDRKGRLFLKGQFALYTALAVDGKTAIEYDADLNEYTKKTLAPGEASEEVESQLEFATIVDEGLIPVAGENPLDADGIEAGIGARSFETLRASVMPAQPFGGEACDLVRISVASRDEDDDALVTKQQTYWFARSDGRLMRWQTQTVTDGEARDVTDGQVTLQEFNPTFSAKDFAFTVPKGAKLSED